MVALSLNAMVIRDKRNVVGAYARLRPVLTMPLVLPQDAINRTIPNGANFITICIPSQ